MSKLLLILSLLPACTHLSLEKWQQKKLSCEQGHRKSCVQLGEHYRSHARFEQAGYFWSKACYLKHTLSCQQLNQLVQHWQQKQREYRKRCELGQQQDCQYLPIIEEYKNTSLRVYQNSIDQVTYYSGAPVNKYITVPLDNYNRTDLYRIIYQGNWYCAYEDKDFMEKCHRRQAWGCYLKSGCFIVAKGQIVRAVNAKIRTQKN